MIRPDKNKNETYSKHPTSKAISKFSFHTQLIRSKSKLEDDRLLIP